MKARRFYLVILLLFAFAACKDQKVNEEKKIVVGVFNGNGAGSVCVIETIEALKIDKDIHPLIISAKDIQNGKLDDLDVLIFPGGSGSKQLNNLGNSGKEIVRKFVMEDGKGVVGICAGAYLLSTTPGYPCLELGNVKVIDRAHYARGRGLIEFGLNKAGEKIFPEARNIKQFCQYYDGPVMETLTKSKNYTEIGTYLTDIHLNNGAPEEFTPGKLFLYNEIVGKGRLFAIAGHPESTPGKRWMVPRMVRWASKKKLVSYNNNLLKPEKYKKEILFNKELKRFEKARWWQLFNVCPDSVIVAMNDLHAICSRPAVRWNMGLLRNSSPKVRIHAARLLNNSEYTAALPDIISAYESEEDIDVKNEFEGIINDMQSICNNQ